LKIAIEKVHNANTVFEDSALELGKVLEGDGHYIEFFESDELPPNYDGFVLFPYLFSTKNKIEILKSQKPFISISNEFFNRELFSTKYVRILINGNVNNWGVWNKEIGIKKWKMFESILKPKFLSARKFYNTALFTPTAISADINFRTSPLIWLMSTVEYNITKSSWEKIIIKVHPKFKSAYAKQQNNYLLRLEEAINDWKIKYTSCNFELINDPTIRNLSSLNYGTCFNSTSTASIEAALSGHRVHSTNSGDFLYHNELRMNEEDLVKKFEDIAGCLWQPSEMQQFWDYNKFYFLENFKARTHNTKYIQDWINRL
jgi:hypothetical protein